MGEKMDLIKTLPMAAKDLGFSDIKKFKSEFDPYVFVVSGQEMVDMEYLEQHIMDVSNPLSDNFQGLKKISRKPSKDNIGLIQARITRRKRKIKALRKAQNERQDAFQKSGTDFDQLQYLTAQVKVSEAEAGLVKMEAELSVLIKERISDLETELQPSSEAGIES